ncbi:hypothetical protein BpHYR1_047780 [Brachionus plicatilis]|uniref:Uncharacterized protein n=1 Tax=Brachionus plicatilis TaxID=10195 RepID=A0A3M7T8P5_BRAPC|nr:hypothetical protein BpHYR1_047780 [Brachionus plicatilis]
MLKIFVLNLTRTILDSSLKFCTFHGKPTEYPIFFILIFIVSCVKFANYKIISFYRLAWFLFKEISRYQINREPTHACTNVSQLFGTANSGTVEKINITIISLSNFRENYNLNLADARCLP